MANFKEGENPFQVQIFRYVVNLLGLEAKVKYNLIQLSDLNKLPPIVMMVFLFISNDSLSEIMKIACFRVNV